MFDRDLRRYREAVRLRNYHVLEHALDEMEEERLGILDVESAILSGAIVQRQRDRRTSERKAVIEGRTKDGREVAVVVKRTASGRMALITVYRIRDHD
jgi:Domain of unknown function (DUF4258)